VEHPVLCWDIDGTLLTTGRAGIAAWEQALRNVIQSDRDLSSYKTVGRTDVEIARALIEESGQAFDRKTVGELIKQYEAFLPQCLGDRKGWVLPGVREFLEWNAQQLRLPCILLTGNTKAGADAKLRHYGLDSFFQPGAFASLETPDRASIAAEALRIVRELLPNGSAERMVVIGDTPFDIACGLSVGARTIGVASGIHGLEELSAAGAWRSLRSLPSPAALVQLLL
jgi:phosphoglycolate phosphatase-like HAD superfamily hydrolase